MRHKIFIYMNLFILGTFYQCKKTDNTSQLPPTITLIESNVKNETAVLIGDSIKLNFKVEIKNSKTTIKIQSYSNSITKTLGQYSSDQSFSCCFLISKTGFDTVSIYAINGSNQSTSQKIVFFAKKPISYGSVLDIEGNNYKTVTIGTQTWMAENLRTKKYNNGDSIKMINDYVTLLSSNYGAYIDYTKNIDTLKLFGSFYNWFAVSSGKLCPNGWHVPTLNDWKVFGKYLTTNDEFSNNDGVGYMNGFDLIAKSIASTSGWSSDDSKIYEKYNYPSYAQYSNNTTGFNGFPCGSIGTGTKIYPELAYPITIWWTQTDTFNMGYHFAYAFSLGNSQGIDRILPSVYEGESVRCLKN